MLDSKGKKSGPEIPPLPEAAPGQGDPPVAPPPPVGSRADAIERLAAELSQAKARIAELERSLADVSAAKNAAESMLEATTAECERLRAQAPSDEDAAAAVAPPDPQVETRAAELVEARQLYQDSQDRVELLESRLGDTLAQLDTAKAKGQQSAKFEEEIAVARSLIDSLETACRQKESKLGEVQSEVAALRNILKHVDAASIEAAKRRLANK